jgi:hypothetical protein
MSQQEFVPQQGSERLGGDVEIYQHLYKAPKSGSVPKEEHPSTFEASMPAYSYHAQDATSQRSYDPVSTAHPHETDERARRYRRRRFSPDGDALENGYRPYEQRQRMHYAAPSWARPQRHNGPHLLRWIVLITLGIILLKPLLILLGALFLAGVGVVALIILIPLIVIGAVLFGAFAIALLGLLLGRAVWRGGWR